jgi:hemerythrin-like metal-binding protein
LPVVRLIWNGQYRSGNTAIDTDHEYLFERANTLLVDMQRNADDGALAADLQDLLIWLSTHFRTEERILAGIDWHGLAEHTRQHRALEARGRRILADIQAGNGNFGDLLDFVVMDVISRHLAQHDVGFFSCVPKGAGGRHAPG